MNLENKIIVITGGSRGIGLSMAKTFIESQSKVIILDKAKPKIKANDLLYIKCDVSNNNEVKKNFKTIAKIYGKIDILINNAGIQIEETFNEYDYKKWLNIMNTNYFGVCNCIHACVNNMKEGSTILNIISIHSYKPRTNKYAYDSSKSAIEILTKELALEFAEKKITINALSFGAVETNMNDIWKNDPKLKENALNKVPLKIIFTPNEIANFAKIILTSFSKYTTGSIFIIDGGRSLM